MGETNTPPSWLNADFWLHALTCGESHFEIISFEIEPALPVGENFASEVYKSKIKYKEKGKNNSTKQKNFFVKVPVENGPLADVVSEQNFIAREREMYYEYFPLVEKCISNCGLFPKHFPSKGKSTLVLEDLAGEGYIMCDKIKQLDFEHSAEVLKSLAYFHSASVFLDKHNHTFIENLGNTMLFKTDSSKFSIYFKEKCTVFINVVKNWKGFERFSDMCRQYNETSLDDARKIYARRKTLNVMNHGDTWTNNIMFKYDKGGNIENVKLIDFQISIYGSLGIDLQYFTWTSIQPSVREHRLPELYKLYLGTLNSCLEKLGCDERMNMEQFEEEMDFCLFYIYFGIVVSYCIMLFGRYKDTHVVSDGDRQSLTVYDDEWYRTNVEQALLFLESKGFFGKFGEFNT